MRRPEINAATKVGNERERLQHGRVDGAEMYVELGEVNVVDRKAMRSLGSKIKMCADPLGGSPDDQTTSRGWIHADVADVRCPRRKSLLRTKSSISIIVQYE